LCAHKKEYCFTLWQWLEMNIPWAGAPGW
jgi:hypothetical protein